MFSTIDKYTILAEEYFSGLKGKIQVFAFDWLGRFFALDQRRINNERAEILLIEPGAGEAMEIPVGIEEFHNIELVDYADDSLARSLFIQWRLRCKVEIGYSECVGYRIPLFLGGKDSIENLEMVDLDVYFSLCAQLRNKTKSMRPGQTIKSISMGS